MVTKLPRPILLGGYAAKQCPVRVQNDFLPLTPRLKWVPTPEDQARLDAGNAFEAQVFAALQRLHHGAVVVDTRLGKDESIEVTVQAMDAAVPLILGGRLPDDADGGRTGKPDILIRLADGYLPADVKNHQTVKPAKTTRVAMSSLTAPDARLEITGWSAAGYRHGDGMQLAHYTRMLQACDRHPGQAQLWGAVLGTSQLEVTPGAGPKLVFVWHNLEAPVNFTFSRSRGKARRSLLERYDHEHGFRVKVADTARHIVGGEKDPRPLVEPVGQEECDSCPYGHWCAEQMGPEDPSTAINIGRLTPRGWLALRQLGVTTTAALAAVDPDDPLFFDDYYAEVTHLSRTQARDQLAAVIERAQMICEGIEISRTGDGPAIIPVADVEIDVDIEYDFGNRVYMWGARLRHRNDESTAHYVSDFVAWEPLDDPAEQRLAAHFAAWLRHQCEAAAAAGQSLKVFHWSHPERSKLVSLLGLDNVGDLVDPETGVFVDLEKVFKANFFALHGSSIKKVAPLFGFAWRVDDPGGAISQTYLSRVHTSADPDEISAAKQWLLTYNEDDNAAMAAIRDGIIDSPF